jgi:hypothetical protein
MENVDILGDKMEIRFDKENNRLVLTTDNGEEVFISPQCIRDLLPTMNEEEKIKDLEMILHDIDREKLTKMESYMALMRKLQDGITEAREELKKADSAILIKKWEAVGKSYVDEKNALAEIRRAVGLLEKDRKVIRVRIAKLETQSDQQ